MQLFVFIIHIICLIEIQDFSDAIDSNKPFNNTGEIMPRIIRGSTAKLGVFPYIASLSYDEFPIFCGGSIIHKNWVLTAAHCCDTSQSEAAKITVGTVSLEGRVYRVRELIRHYGFSHKSEEDNNGIEFVIHDIGLVHLKESIEFNFYVSPIQLDRRSYLDYNYETASIAGWGEEKFGTGELSPVLKYITIHVLPQEDCRKDWPYASCPHICTSTLERKSACSGDSGGPVVLTHEYIQVGIVSTADEKCEFKKSNLHTRVSNYIMWIQWCMNYYNDFL